MLLKILYVLMLWQLAAAEDLSAPVHGLGNYQHYSAPSPFYPTFKRMLPFSRFSDEEYPRELLHLARTKWNAQSMMRVPTISELKELLSTSSTEDTLAHLRKLLETPEGVLMMNVFVSTNPFTDAAAAFAVKLFEAGYPQTEALQATKAAEQLKPGVAERMTSYYHIYRPDLAGFEQTRKPLQADASTPLPRLSLGAITAPIGHKHLNSARAKASTYVQLAKALKVSPEKLELYLRDKPKLAQIATRFSNMPLTNKQGAMIDTHLLAAVQRTLAQDMDLTKLIAEIETLK